MCLSTGPCSNTSTACQQPCATAQNSVFDMLADGTIRPRKDHSQCLTADAKAPEDGSVYLSACNAQGSQAVALNAVWVNQTMLASRVYVGACVRLAFGRSLPRQGICFNVLASGEWELLNGARIASGPLKGSALGAWHALQLDVSGGDVSASINGTVVAQVKGAASGLPQGMACLASGYNVAYFDNAALK